jgi:hypothetical protein
VSYNPGTIFPVFTASEWSLRSAIGLALLGALVTLLVALLLDPSFAVAGDAHYTFATARSIAYDGDLDLHNQYQVMGDRWGLARHHGRDGVVLPPREIGTALLMVPGLAAHHLLHFPDTFEPWLAVLPAALALGGFFWIARGCSEPHAWPWVLAATLGGTLPFYVLGRAGYAHAPDALACAVLGCALMRARRKPELRTVIGCGALLAIAMLMRLQNALWLAWPLTRSLLSHGQGERAAWLRLAGGMLVIGCLGIVPQLLGAALHPGSPLGVFRWGLDFFDLRHYPLDLVRVLVGHHGLLSFTPIAVVAVFGLIAGARSDVHRDRCLPALAVLGAMVLLMAAVRDPDAGTAFGARRLTGATILVVLGLTTSRDLAPVAWRKRVGGLVVGAVVVNLALTTAAILGWLSLD